MGRSFLLPAREATEDTLVATGAAGVWGVDPVDGDRGWQAMGTAPREFPTWSLDRARAFSLAAYRANPMARAIIDTYIAFCVGDKGVTFNAPVPEVHAVCDSFWRDSRNRIADRQELALRSNLLNGETVYEMLVGDRTGITRFSVIDPTRVRGVLHDRGNPLWPGILQVQVGAADVLPMAIVQPDELTHLRTGDVQFWPSFKALETDTRGTPFMTPILDWLDSYDAVISNLIDRTALARYLTWDVTIDGTGDDVDEFIRKRGGTAAPRSGSVEVHNKSVEWEAKYATTGANEDSVTAQAIMTGVAGGAGLAKTWLAEPEDSNRATSLTMAEPVRRRVSSVQKMWLDNLSELTRFAVDRAVAVGELPAMVQVKTDAGSTRPMPASDTVRVTGPEIAAADASINATVLVNLSQALDGMVAANVLSPAAATVAAKKAWEDFMGIPYNPELDKADGSRVEDVAGEVDAAQNAGGQPGKVVALAGSQAG